MRHVYDEASRLRRRVFSRRIDEIFAAVSQKMLLAVGAAVRVEAVDLPRVDVHAVLTILGKRDAERHEVVADAMRHVLAQLLLLDPVLVQRRHEVRQGSRHPECDLL